MEEVMPSLARKKKIYINNIESSEISFVPNKHTKPLKSNDLSPDVKPKEFYPLTRPNKKIIKQSHKDIKLISFNKNASVMNSSLENNEIDDVTSPRAYELPHACKGNSPDLNLLNPESITRRLSAESAGRARREGFYGGFRSCSVDDNLDSIPEYIGKMSVETARVKGEQRDDCTIKSLRETFDEFRSQLYKKDDSEQSNKTENSLSNHERFKRISEIPQFLQSKQETENANDKVSTHPRVAPTPPLPSRETIKNLSNSLVSSSHFQMRKNLPPGAVPTPFRFLIQPSCETYKKSVEQKSKQEKEQEGPWLSKSLKSLPGSDEIFGGYLSEEGLSDDGDVILNDDEELEFSRPSNEVLLRSVPIVHSQHHLVRERKGYLYKYTAGQTYRLPAKLVTNWQKRWVTLDPNFLTYYSSNKSEMSRRVLPVCTMSNVKQIIKQSEQHPFRFKIVMKHKKIFNFAADTSDDLSWWTSITMKAIMDKSSLVDLETNNRVSESIEEGGDLHCPDMQGFVKMEGLRGRKWMACKHEKFALYNNQLDFETYSPVFMLNMQLANVRDIGKMKLQINTPQANYVFSFETQDETNAWRNALENCISVALGDDEVMKEVCKNTSNRFCVDCGAEGPEWAAINMGVTLCQNCAGIHRKLVTAKIRSLRMDSKVWSGALIEMMKAIGNEKSNKLWGRHIKDEDIIEQSCEQSKRSQFIERKYEEKRFFHYHQHHDNKEKLNQLLRESLHSDDLILILQILFSGADVNQILQENEEKPIKDISPIILEFLKQNTGHDRTRSSSSQLCK